MPDDLCPLGASRVELTGVPRVAAVYVWGSDEPTVLALHGWGADSTTMSAVVAAATGQRRVGGVLRRPRARRLTGIASDDDGVRGRYSRSTAAVSEHPHHRRPFVRIDRRSLGGRSGRPATACAICSCSLRRAHCRTSSNDGQLIGICHRRWSSRFVVNYGAATAGRYLIGMSEHSVFRRRSEFRSCTIRRTPWCQCATPT